MFQKAKDSSITTFIANEMMLSRYLPSTLLPVNKDETLSKAEEFATFMFQVQSLIIKLVCY